MEQDGEQLSTRPALETEGLRFLHATVGSLLATYGWYILFGCILLYVAIQKLSIQLRALRQRQQDQAASAVEPDAVVKRQEALAAARLRMQEELDAQVEKHKEKLRQENNTPEPSTSSVVPKRKSDKKPLRGGGYNPLTGEGGGTCSWRPGRRGPSGG
ncbi:selenoprotein S isoform X2 [Perognathus longimembris pacificus]|uniref:selenoprotein S isoform X2 n=1 Tax=Perognathus longimembris pacificus TaxID=214514 RepID=UPI002018E19E|nr:selenoprotein S isoform X2 [Perognathus longimembris pacificus]